MKETELKILGMTCEHCVRTVKNALYNVEGVSEVDVSLHEQSAKVKAEDHGGCSKNPNPLTHKNFSSKI
jgi:copper chaperone